jgi:hypothetical protein
VFPHRWQVSLIGLWNQIRLAASQAVDDAASLNLILFPLMATLRTVVFLHVLREGCCGMSLAKQNLIS